MRTIYLDGLKIHDITEFTTLGYFAPKGIVGTEAPAFSVSSYNRAGEDGIRIPTVYARERRYTLEVVVKAATAATHATLRRALMAKMMPNRDTSDILQSKVLRFVDYDGADYSVNVQVMSFTVGEQNSRISRFQLDLLGEDFAIYGTTQNSLALTPASPGGFSIPFSIPFSFSGGVTGSGYATNGGTIDTYPLITLNGSLTNPIIHNVTLGKFIQLQMTINNGSSVVIDMRNKTIVQGGVTSQISKMTDASDWWYLQPGANEISLVTSIAGEAGSAQLVWNDAYVGV